MRDQTFSLCSSLRSKSHQFAALCEGGALFEPDMSLIRGHSCGRIQRKARFPLGGPSNAHVCRPPDLSRPTKRP